MISAQPFDRWFDRINALPNNHFFRTATYRNEPVNIQAAWRTLGHGWEYDITLKSGTHVHDVPEYELSNFAL